MRKGTADRECQRDSCLKTLPSKLLVKFLDTDLAVVPREKPHTGAAAREQPRDSPVIERGGPSSPASHSVSPVSFPHRSGQPMAPSHHASLAHEGPPGPSPAPRFGCGPLQGSHPHLATGHRPPGPSPATVHPVPAQSTRCPPQTCSGPRPPGAHKPPDPKRQTG